MSKAIRVNSDDAFEYLSKALKQGEKKKHRELIDILKKGFEGIGESQCAGIIYRAHTNKNAILKKEGSNYMLRTEEDKTAEGLDLVREKIDQFIEEIENIPASQFKTYDTFSKYKELLERLQQIKHI